MKTVGLTSGICGGKSLVAAEFKRLGAKLVDADKIVSQLYRGDNPLKKEIKKFFGERALTARGAVNRKFLSSIVFSDKQKLRKLNALVHPLVFHEIKKKISGYKKKNFSGLTVVDVPLLFESSSPGLFDFVLVVKATKEQQLRRLMARDRVTRSQALARINCQLALSKKVKLADYVIDNTGAPAKTRAQARKLYRKLVEP